jgi:hypothetical protein
LSAEIGKVNGGALDDLISDILESFLLWSSPSPFDFAGESSERFDPLGIISQHFLALDEDTEDMSKRRNVARGLQVSQWSKVSLGQRPLTVTELETSKLSRLEPKTGLLDAQCDMKSITDLQKGDEIVQ